MCVTKSCEEQSTFSKFNPTFHSEHFPKHRFSHVTATPVAIATQNATLATPALPRPGARKPKCDNSMIWNKATYFLSNLGIGLDNDSYTMLHTVWDSYIMIVIPSPIILSIITDIQVRSVNVSYNLSSGMSSTQCCSSCSSLICCSDSSWLNLLPHLPLGVPTLDISWHFVESWASGQITSPPHATRASPLGFSYWPQIYMYIYIYVCVYMSHHKSSKQWPGHGSKVGRPKNVRIVQHSTH